MYGEDSKRKKITQKKNDHQSVQGNKFLMSVCNFSRQQFYSHSVRVKCTLTSVLVSSYLVFLDLLQCLLLIFDLVCVQLVELVARRSVDDGSGSATASPSLCTHHSARRTCSTATCNDVTQHQTKRTPQNLQQWTGHNIYWDWAQRSFCLWGCLLCSLLPSFPSETQGQVWEHVNVLEKYFTARLVLKHSHSAVKIDTRTLGTVYMHRNTCTLLWLIQERQ